jgi:hypothetical protein
LGVRFRNTSGWRGRQPQGHPVWHPRHRCSEDSKCIYANPLTPEAGEPLRLLGLPFCLGFPVSGTEGVRTLAVKAHLSFFRTCGVPANRNSCQTTIIWFAPVRFELWKVKIKMTRLSPANAGNNLVMKRKFSMLPY